MNRFTDKERVLIRTALLTYAAILRYHIQGIRVMGLLDSEEATQKLNEAHHLEGLANRFEDV